MTIRVVLDIPATVVMEAMEALMIIIGFSIVYAVVTPRRENEFYREDAPLTVRVEPPLFGRYCGVIVSPTGMPRPRDATRRSPHAGQRLSKSDSSSESMSKSSLSSSIPLA